MTEIPEEAVKAASDAIRDAQDSGQIYPWTYARAALAAALPHLRVQETRGEVTEHSEEDQWYCPTSDSIECYHAGFDVCCDAPEKHVALSFDLVEKAVVAYHAAPAPRPVDREALATVLRVHYQQHGPGIVSGKPFEARCTCGTQYDHGKFYEHVADAVLALLPTEEDTKATVCTCRTIAPSGWDTVQQAVEPRCPLHSADTKGEGS